MTFKMLPLLAVSELPTTPPVMLTVLPPLALNE
jgi:hypothetical protein